MFTIAVRSLVRTINLSEKGVGNREIEGFPHLFVSCYKTQDLTCNGRVTTINFIAKYEIFATFL